MSEDFCFRSYFIQEDIVIFKELLINDQINTNEVRLIGQDGTQYGIVSIAKAKEIATESDLDLVLMSSSSTPYVCKIMDYGKYKFDAIKKEKELKKNQKVSELKEIQLSMTIDTHDLEVKAKHGRRFLNDGDKVKVVLRMRGRQQAYTQNGIEVVKDFFNMLSDVGMFDKGPEVVGRNILLIISPKK